MKAKIGYRMTEQMGSQGYNDFHTELRAQGYGDIGI